MKIGLYLKWSLAGMHREGWIIGEAHYALSLCREFAKLPGVEFARPYDYSNWPDTQLDVMIHLNGTEPLPGKFTKKNFLYLQNGYWEGMDAALARLRLLGYDGYAFISPKLLARHQQDGYRGLYLPFGVDLSTFQPQGPNLRYNYEVAYAGNDIKGSERTMQYLCPALNYNFGLFGRWIDDGLFHQKVLSPICQGRLAYKDLPQLYSNTIINLNFTFPDQVNWGAMTDRPLQIMACNGFVIGDYIPEGDDEITGCMAVSKGGLDLIRKIDYYLARPKQRREIAANGRQYALRNAGLENRVRQLYSYLKETL